MKKISGILFLFGAAVLWGIAFVAQDVGLEYIGPFTFTCVRCFLGGVTLFFLSIACDLIKGKRNPIKLTKEEKKVKIKYFLIGGLVCGIVMACAVNVQQVGLVYTTAGKAGFITACYIVLVPVIGIFMKKKCPFTVWISIGMAVLGLYFLCMSGGFDGINKGDIIMMGSAVCFAFHIIVIDVFVGKVDGVKLACAQCFVCSLVSAVPMFIFETPTMDGIIKSAVPILYTGICSAGLAYMFQILGQKRLPPTLASIVMSLESVISVIAAWIILDQSLTGKEILGCLIVFSAIILAQIPKKQREIRTLYNEKIKVKR